MTHHSEHCVCPAASHHEPQNAMVPKQCFTLESPGESLKKQNPKLVMPDSYPRHCDF